MSKLNIILKDNIRIKKFNNKISSQIYSKFEKIVSDIYKEINDAKKTLKRTMEEAVQKTMIADCPVGSFLSGGIDSSLITSILSQNYNNVQTFSIGFNDAEFNEAKGAKSIANWITHL